MTKEVHSVIKDTKYINGCIKNKTGKKYAYI